VSNASHSRLGIHLKHFEYCRDLDDNAMRTTTEEFGELLHILDREGKEDMDYSSCHNLEETASGTSL
jgi:hypothetical protein